MSGEAPDGSRPSMKEAILRGIFDAGSAMVDAAVLHQPTREILERVREEASRVARAVPLVAEVLRNINLGRNPEEREAAQETLESHRNWERVNRLSQSRRGLSNRDWEFLQGVSRGEAKAEAATGQELATARLVVDAAIR